MKLSSKDCIRKLLAVLLALMFVIAATVPLTGCNSDDDDKEPAAPGDDPDEEEPKIQRVGFIYAGRIEGSAHNRMWEDARLALERNLDVETYYIENVFVVNFQEAADLFATKGIDTIVSTSHYFTKMVQEAARTHQDVKFISFGGRDVLSPNITSFQPLLYQPAHVAGFAAARNVSDGIGDIGVVVDPRMFNLYGVVNSFIKGARQYFTNGVRVHVREIYSGHESEARDALNEFRSLGIDTVLCYVDTHYAIRYAEQIGMKVVGYANNIEQLAPNYHIAGFYFDIRSYLTEVVAMLYHDNFAPRATYADMLSGRVGMSELNPNTEIIVAATHRNAGEIRNRVLNGTASIFRGEIFDNHGTLQVPNAANLSSHEILDIGWWEFSIGSRHLRVLEPRPSPPVVPLRIRLGANAQAVLDLARAAAANEPQ
jgi:basic membrane lipoprotein Med (substrate-binding protein (PBP1-ABC) superfamily)